MCASYIATGSGLYGESLQGVVEIMREMSFLHSETDYSSIIEEIKDSYREEGEWYTIDEVVEEAKTRAARRWRRENPEALLDNVPLLVRRRF